MGLQFSVDAGKPKAESGNQTTTPVVSVGHRTLPSTITAQPSLSRGSAESKDFVTTSESRRSTGNLKYSLPTVNLTDNPVEAAEIDEIMTRI